MPDKTPPEAAEKGFWPDIRAIFLAFWLWLHPGAALVEAEEPQEQAPEEPEADGEEEYRTDGERFGPTAVTRTLSDGAGEPLDAMTTLAVALLGTNGCHPEDLARGFGLPREEVDDFLAPMPAALGLNTAKSVIRQYTHALKSVEELDEAAYMRALTALLTWYSHVLSYKEQLKHPADAVTLTEAISACIVAGVSAEKLNMEDEAYADYKVWLLDYHRASAFMGLLGDRMAEDVGVGPVLRPSFPGLPQPLVHG